MVVVVVVVTEVVVTLVVEVEVVEVPLELEILVTHSTLISRLFALTWTGQLADKCFIEIAGTLLQLVLSKCHAW